MNDSSELDQQLWELVYDLLPAEEARELEVKIRSDRALARRYAEVRLQADLVANASKLPAPAADLSVSSIDPSVVATPKKSEKRNAGDKQSSHKQITASLKATANHSLWMERSLMAIAASLLFIMAGSGVIATRPIPLAQLAANYPVVSLTTDRPLIEGVSSRLRVSVTDTFGEPLAKSFSGSVTSSRGTTPLAMAWDKSQAVAPREPTTTTGQVNDQSIELRGESILPGSKLSVQLDGVAVDDYALSVQANPIDDVLVLEKPLASPGETIHYFAYGKRRIGGEITAPKTNEVVLIDSGSKVLAQTEPANRASKSSAGVGGAAEWGAKQSGSPVKGSFTIPANADHGLYALAMGDIDGLRASEEPLLVVSEEEQRLAGNAYLFGADFDGKKSIANLAMREAKESLAEQPMVEDSAAMEAAPATERRREKPDAMLRGPASKQDFALGVPAGGGEPAAPQAMPASGPRGGASPAPSAMAAKKMMSRSAVPAPPAADVARARSELESSGGSAVEKLEALSEPTDVSPKIASAEKSGDSADLQNSDSDVRKNQRQLAESAAKDGMGDEAKRLADEPAFGKEAESSRALALGAMLPEQEDELLQRKKNLQMQRKFAEFSATLRKQPGAAEQQLLLEIPTPKAPGNLRVVVTANDVVVANQPVVLPTDSNADVQNVKIPLPAELQVPLVAQVFDTSKGSPTLWFQATAQAAATQRTSQLAVLGEQAVYTPGQTVELSLQTAGSGGGQLPQLLGVQVVQSQLLAGSRLFDIEHESMSGGMMGGGAFGDSKSYFSDLAKRDSDRAEARSFPENDAFAADQEMAMDAVTAPLEKGKERSYSLPALPEPVVLVASNQAQAMSQLNQAKEKIAAKQMFAKQIMLGSSMALIALTIALVGRRMVNSKKFYWPAVARDMAWGLAGIAAIVFMVVKSDTSWTPSSGMLASAPDPKPEAANERVIPESVANAPAMPMSSAEQEFGSARQIVVGGAGASSGEDTRNQLSQDPHPAAVAGLEATAAAPAPAEMPVEMSAAPAAIADKLSTMQKKAEETKEQQAKAKGGEKAEDATERFSKPEADNDLATANKPAPADKQSLPAELPLSLLWMTEFDHPAEQAIPIRFTLPAQEADYTLIVHAIENGRLVTHRIPIVSRIPDTAAPAAAQPAIESKAKAVPE